MEHKNKIKMFRLILLKIKANQLKDPKIISIEMILTIGSIKMSLKKEFFRIV